MTRQGHEIRINNSNHNLIANNEGTLNQKFDQAELNACIQIRQLYMCPQIRVLSKTSTIATSCLYALYQSDMGRAQKRCIFELQPINWTVEFHQVETENFLVFSRHPRKAKLTCANGTTTEHSYSEGVTSLNLPNGCMMNTQDYYISSPRIGWVGPEVTIVNPPKTTPVNLLELINELRPNDRITKNTLQQLLTRKAEQLHHRPIPLTDLAQAAQQAHRHPTWHDHTAYVSIGSTTIAVFSVIGILAIFIVRRLRRVQPLLPRFSTVHHPRINRLSHPTTPSYLGCEDAATLFGRGQL